jgi:hypothetical protein
MTVKPMLRDRRRVLKFRHPFASLTTEDDCSNAVTYVRSAAALSLFSLLVKYGLIPE